MINSGFFERFYDGQRLDWNIGEFRGIIQYANEIILYTQDTIFKGSFIIRTAF